jgi:hypothetical protein
LIRACGWSRQHQAGPEPVWCSLAPTVVVALVRWCAEQRQQAESGVCGTGVLVHTVLLLHGRGPLPRFCVSVHCKREAGGFGCVRCVLCHCLVHGCVTLGVIPCTLCATQACVLHVLTLAGSALTCHMLAPSAECSLMLRSVFFVRAGTSAASVRWMLLALVAVLC